MKKFDLFYDKIIESISDEDEMTIEDFCNEFGGEKTLDDLHQFIISTIKKFMEKVTPVNTQIWQVHFNN